MGAEKRKTTSDFISESTVIHYNKYDYSKVNYVNRNTKVTIICPIHGEFEQTPNGHQKGYGCYECGKNKRTKSTDNFIVEAKKVHGNKYAYAKTKYTHIFTKVIITCPEHGDFEQQPNNHLNGCGCKQCSLDDVSKQFSDNTETFIEKAKSVHGNKYDYSKVNYINSDTKVVIICNKHGEFEQLPSNHKAGRGCPTCMSSKGEENIKNWLRTNNISYKPQHKFDNCKHIKKLPFDFYLPDYNICIEFNGRQHYEPVDYFGGNDGFIKTQIRDKIKKKYCFDNKINLTIIKHDEDIIEKLKAIL